MKLGEIKEINHHKKYPISDQEYEQVVQSYLTRWSDRFRNVILPKKQEYFKMHERWIRSQRKVKQLPESYEWVTLEIHHQYYIKNVFAWEYDLSALITLCSDCHRKVHYSDKVNIPFFREHPDVNILFEDQKHIMILDKERCNRCGGYGYISRYNHIEDGICFKCYGVGYNHS